MLGTIRNCLLAGTFVMAGLITATDSADGQEPRPVVLRGVKCIMDGVRSCNTQYWQEYQQGRVFFSSQENADRFRQAINDPVFDPPASLLMRANHQLALTGQVKQIACPVTGEALDYRHKLHLAGVAIYFSDPQSRESIETLEGMIPRVERVFHPNVFDQSFTPAQAEQDIPAEQLIDLPRLNFSTLVADQHGTRCQR